MSLERVSGFDLFLLIVCALVLIGFAITVPLARREPEPAPTWHDPAAERPLSGERVVGEYPRKGMIRAALISEDVVYTVSVQDGVPIAEYWIAADIDGGAGPDLGRAYRWGYPPQIQDLLLEGLAR